MVVGFIRGVVRKIQFQNDAIRQKSLKTAELGNN